MISQFAPSWPHNFTPAGLKTVPRRVWANLERWRDSLRVWASPRDNAFWALAHRIEARHGHPAFVWFWTILAWAFFALCSADEWNSTQALAGRLPLYEGRDTTGFLALLWLNVFLGAACVSARVRATALLRAMLLKGQLVPLQGAPMEDELRAWHPTAPPALVGFIVALGALPALCFGLGHGDWMARDLLGLAFLLAVSVWSVPPWSPGVWQARIEKRGANSKNDGFWKPDHLNIAWVAWRSVPLAVVTVLLAAPSLFYEVPLEVWAGVAPEVQRLAPGLTLNWPLFFSRFLVTPLPFFGFTIPPLVVLLPLWMATQDRKLLQLAATLGAARQFWTPARQTRWHRDQNAMAWLWLLVGLGFAWPSLIGHAELGQFFALTTLAPVAGISMTTQSVAAWFTLCAFGTLTAFTALWGQAMEAQSQSDYRAWRDEIGGRRQSLAARQAANPPTNVSPRALWAYAWARARRALWVGLTIWLGACLLGWQAPLEGDTLHLNFMALAIGAVWVLAQMAVRLGTANRVGGPCWPPYGLSPTTIYLAWFYGGLGINLAALFAGTRWNGTQWQPWMLLLSPLTLWLTTPRPEFLWQTIFWPALAAHALFGAWWMWSVWRALPVAASDATLETAPDAAAASGAPRHAASDRSWMEYEATIESAKAPTVKRATLKAPPGQARPTRLSRAPLATPTASQKRVLSWSARFDNPLLTLETRRQMGNADWILSWWVFAGLGVLGFIGLIYLNSDFSTIGTRVDWVGAAYVSFGLAVAFALVLSLGYATHANDCYDRDRLEGTLESLFLSPLTEAAIVQSKLLPHFALLWPPNLLLLPFLTASGLMAFIQDDSKLLLLVVPTVLAMLALVARNVTLSQFFALTGRKTGGGTTRMTLIAVPMLCVELALLIAALDQGLGVLSLALLVYALVLVIETWRLWAVSVKWLGRIRRVG